MGRGVVERRGLNKIRSAGRKSVKDREEIVFFYVRRPESLL